MAGDGEGGGSGAAVDASWDALQRIAQEQTAGARQPTLAPEATLAAEAGGARSEVGAGERQADAPEDARVGAAVSGGGKGVNPDVWAEAFEQRAKLYAQQKAQEQEPKREAPPPTSPDAMYPPPREKPNTERGTFDKDGWVGIYGSNKPVYKSPDPLPPVGTVFFFRVCGEQDEQPVYERAHESSEKIGTRKKDEVVRVTDFQGQWVRLACETEAQVEERWEGWMISEDGEETLLEEIEDPNEHEKEYTKSLFRRLWKINDHVVQRARERTPRALQYLETGRVPPGQKAQLPEGTRCTNAFWGLEARFVKLAEGEEYWPQGCLTLSPGYVRSGWEQPAEETRCGHWRVFAARPFGAHELIEVCPLVVVDIQTCIASMQLRMNIVETPADEDAAVTGKYGRVQNYVPLGYGMLYQQSIELEDVKLNWTPVTNYNCKMITVGTHMYIYSTRKIQADEELILQYRRNFRTDQGEAIDFTGFTPYWCRKGHPEAFAKALSGPCGPRKVRPVPGQVKFGKSKLHDRGVYADANYKKGEIIEMCPCLILDTNGADCMQDYCFQLPEVKVEVAGRTVVKRQSRYILPCGYGGIYNHLETGKGENVQWLYDETTQCCVWIADPQDGSSEIRRNEELCFDYGEAYWDSPQRRYQRPGATNERRDMLEELSKKRTVVDCAGNLRHI